MSDVCDIVNWLRLPLDGRLWMTTHNINHVQLHSSKRTVVETRYSCYVYDIFIVVHSYITIVVYWNLMCTISSRSAEGNRLYDYMFE